MYENLTYMMCIDYISHMKTMLRECTHSCMKTMHMECMHIVCHYERPYLWNVLIVMYENHVYGMRRSNVIYEN